VERAALAMGVTVPVHEPRLKIGSVEPWHKGDKKI
jgi:hypothetical protein